MAISTNCSRLIKLNSKGRVLFSKIDQVLIIKFICYKFRSMTVNNDSDSKQATENDVRITSVGKFLKKNI